MAVPLIEQETQIAFSDEAVPGTAEVLDASDAVTIAYNVQIQPDDPQNERPAVIGQMGALPSVPGMPTGTASFDVDLMGDGSGGMPLFASALFPSCNGLLSTATWGFGGLRTANCATIQRYEGGKIKGLCGARGTFRIAGSAGGLLRLSFSFIGRYYELTDAANLASIAYPTSRPLRVGDATFTLAAFAAKISQFNLDLGAQNIIRPSVSGVGGFVNAICTNVSPTFSCDPEDELTATRNWRSIRDAGTLEALSFILGSANNRVSIASSTAQTLRVPGDVRDGIRTRALEGMFAAPSTTLFTLKID